jgi:hypothetical protein
MPVDVRRGMPPRKAGPKGLNRFWGNALTCHAPEAPPPLDRARRRDSLEDALGVQVVEDNRHTS